MNIEVGPTGESSSIECEIISMDTPNGPKPIAFRPSDPRVLKAWDAALSGEFQTISIPEVFRVFRGVAKTADEVIEIERRVREQRQQIFRGFVSQPLANPRHIDDNVHSVDRDERKRRQKHFGYLFVKYGISVP